MKYINHVKSNIKGNVDTGLGYRTIIVGPNGSGKSAITNSVEFALSGKVSDIVGRQTVADVHQLLTLGPGDALWADVAIDDGGTARCETKGKKVTAPAYPTAFPLRDVREALAGSTETVRKFFLRMAAGGVTRQDVESRIPAPHLDLFQQAISATPITTSPADLILYALEKSKARARELNAEAKASAAVVSETTAGIEAVSGSDLELARAALASARELVAEHSAALGAAKDRESATIRLEGIAAQITELETALAGIPPPAEADRVRGELVELLRYAQSKGLGTCPCCKVQGRPLSTSGPVHEDVLAPTWRAFDVRFWAERLASVEAKHTARQVELAQYHNALAPLADMRAAYARATAYAQTLATSNDTRTVAEIEQARAEAFNAAVENEQRVIRLERAAATWEQARRARDMAAEREIQATKWAALADACAVAVGELLDVGVKTFEEKVQKYLPTEDRFALQLRDGDREVCRYGFLRGQVDGWPDGEPHARLDIALSGAEWARLTVALAAAYVDGGGDGLHVIIPDDRSWDPITLSSVLEALSNAPAQVILATTTTPARIPEGWTVVRTGPHAAVEPPLDPLDDLVVVNATGGPVAVNGEVLASEGDYIAVGTCPHGVSKAPCFACTAVREVEAAKAKAQLLAAALGVQNGEPAPELPKSVEARERDALAPPVKRGRGRPKGSKTKKEAAEVVTNPPPPDLPLVDLE